MVKKIINLLNKNLHTPIWLFWLLVLLLFLRIPYFFEPYYYGDETIYLTLGEAIRQNIPLYKGIHDNKPPLLYILAAISGDLFWFKAILAVWSLITVYIFYKFVFKLFSNNRRAAKVSTIIFGFLSTIPLFEGNTANAELFMVGPTIAAFYVLLFKKVNKRNIFYSGILFSIAALFKIPAAFEIPVIIVYWIVSGFKKEEFIHFLKKCFVLTSGFLLPIGFTFLWYIFRGAGKEYLTAAFMENFGYLSSWRPDVVSEPFFVKNAPLLFRTATLGTIILFLIYRKKHLSKQFLFSSLWIAFALFAVTLSERPYPHYFIQALPAFSILWSMFFTSRNVEQSLVVAPITLAFFTLVYFRFWQYHTGAYYYKFIRYVTGSISRNEYVGSFGNNVILNYQLSDFLIKSTTRRDKVFVWGDSSHIYALTKRLPPIKYIADYHIKDFSNIEYVVDNLQLNKPKFIIILPNSKPPEKLLLFIKSHYSAVEYKDPVQIYILVPG